MMIRSTHIPIILNRICDDTNIVSALLVTADGELLGEAARTTTTSGTNATTAVSSKLQLLLNQLPPLESLGTLLADIAWDYHRLGEEFSTLQLETAALSPPTQQPTAAVVSSKMECLFLEMEDGIVGISSCNRNSSTTNSSTNSNNNSSSNHHDTVGCFVMVICTPEAPLGWIRQRLQIVTTHVQESLLLSSSILTTNDNNNNNMINNNNIS